MEKRLLSILLVLIMALSVLPTAAFAEDGGENLPACICETACTAEEMNEGCPVCGAEGAQPENCALYAEVPDADDSAPEDEDDEAFEEDGRLKAAKRPPCSAARGGRRCRAGGAYPLLLRRQRQRGRSYQPPGRDLYGVHKGKLPSPDFQHRKSQRSLRLSGE